MATSRPRLTISLAPEVRAVLYRLTEVSGIPASQYIAHLLEDTVPLIEATVKALEKAKKSPEAALGIMARELERTVSIGLEAQYELQKAAQGLKPKKGRGNR